MGSSSYRELRTNDSRLGRDASSMHTALQGTQEIYKRHNLNWTDTLSVMQRKTDYTAASKYIQCFGLQYYVLFDLPGVDKRGSSYRG